jgi:glycine/D-amino acid oxidase-like deaminating enzyme
VSGKHAVVIGGSVVGLLAAAAAAEHFDLVTVLDRDQVADAPTTRGGAPQGHQIHILLPVGEAGAPVGVLG